MKSHRVVSSARSFDVEEYCGADKAGNPVWRKVAYYRTRKSLISGMRRLGIPLGEADGVPDYHDDAFEALLAFAQPPRALTEEHKAKMQAARRSANRSDAA